MKLSDRLAEAQFKNRTDGNWEYSPFPLPFLRCRVITEDQKTALVHNLKLLGTGPHLVLFALIFKLGATFPVLSILALAAMNDRITPLLTISLFAILELPLILAVLHVIFDVLRTTRSNTMLKVNTLNAERGRRVGYAELMKRTGRALGPVCTLLIIAACASALVFSAVLGSLMGPEFNTILLPIIVTIALLPLFRSGLKSREPRSSKD